ncbi:hypothetical protein FLJC2902T_28200 [Flavobacterium limnosediminis JC2902]|uniref:Uncharacterized protein n=1 Tax=Flavobacterium limnosediminis JC2902 TaxID=1341181 RepID=V6SJA4_9FLAO|nr:hypothetical protein FLJC2902T_28200 [Flavobacterium limnosediminis JC2902]
MFLLRKILSYWYGSVQKAVAKQSRAAKYTGNKCFYKNEKELF